MGGTRSCREARRATLLRLRASRAERPPDSMRAGPSKKELQKSVKEMKLAAVDMGGSRMSDDI